MDFFSSEIVPFLETFRNCFSASGFQYFLGFLWLSVGMQERKCLTRLASYCPMFERHVSGLRRLFSESPWNLKCPSGAGCWVFKGGKITAAMLTVAVSAWDITGELASFF